MFKGKKVLVLGLAKSGKAAVELLKFMHADITINESKKKEDIPEYDTYVSEGIEMVCGGQPDELFERDFDFVVKNPGINYHAPFILRLKERGIPVYTEIELGYKVAKKQHYIAVTGTNGKTTTVTLIYEILKAAGRKAHICGNYGIPYCEVVLNEHLYEEEGHDVVVEMSNFQLIDEYYASKMRIYMNQDENDLFINNSDDETLQSYLAQYPVPSRIETFSVKSLADVELKDNAIYYKGQKVISRDEIKIVGLHNVANMMVAVAACRAVGVSLDSIHDTLAAFKGVEHRIEFVRELDGVRYYNDSKGTNTDAAVIAIKAFEKPVILLMGGHEKNLDLKDVREQNPLIKTLICFGETKERFSKDMQHPHTIVVDHMKDAILKAKEIAEEGDVVLLSPSTSSFDEFHSYVERGNVFKDIVNKL